ncbi:hypothetical protein KAR91_01740 [Candidatus Pacearchaeota archaeon]|nr:hypothetical protein [Candidatus Pacearchaeota archaeon]
MTEARQVTTIQSRVCRGPQSIPFLYLSDHSVRGCKAMLTRFNVEWARAEGRGAGWCGASERVSIDILYRKY